MKKNYICIILLALAGALLLSSCSRQPNQSTDNATARPIQTMSVNTAAPTQALETQLPAETPAATGYESQPVVTEPPEEQPSETPTPIPSEEPQATVFPEEPTEEPLPTEIVKLDSFSFADNDIVPVDLDYDGISETVSIVQDAETGETSLVIDAENQFEIRINMDVSSLVCAYVTDFCFGDGSAELLVSYQKHDGSYATNVVGSFSSDTPVSCATFNGWVETLTDDGIRLCRTADVLGERGISMMHTYNSSNGSFVPLERAWTVYSYGQYAVLASEIRAFSAADNEEIILDAGAQLIPTSTDFYSYIDFETDQGITGRLKVSYENGERFMYEGVELNSLFEELPQL